MAQTDGEGIQVDVFVNRFWQEARPIAKDEEIRVENGPAVTYDPISAYHVGIQISQMKVQFSGCRILDTWLVVLIVSIPKG